MVNLWLRGVVAGVAALSLVGSAGLAAGQAGGALQVDTAASRVYIKVSSATRLGHDHGVDGRLGSGAVTLGGAGDLVFDMRTFVADRPEARSYVGLTASVTPSDAQKATATMLGKDVLSVAQFPTARYAIRSSAPAGGQAPGAPGSYRLEGDFTLHGVTQPLPLTAALENTDTPGVFRFRCAFTIRQSQFGMKPYSALGGLVGVSDPLQIWGELIVRPSAAQTAVAAPAATSR
jgi:polyisoprenoid-binding protein YceI